jgi:ribonuclease HI
MGELMSVLDLLRSTRDVDEPLRVLCDSQYAINCCTRWIPAWKKRGWRKADNKPVLNLDLLKQLDAELAGRPVTFQWVKGHAGHPLNEKADDLARAAATAYQQGTPVASGPGYSKAPVTLRDLPTDGDDIRVPEPDPEDDPALVPLPPEPLREAQPSLLTVPYTVRKKELPDTALVVDLTELTREFISDRVQLDRERLNELMHPDYVAHLPGGVIRTKGSIMARPANLSGSIQLDVLGADRLAEDITLLRYKVKRNSQDFLCVMLWQRTAGTWQARFQQVTAITG